MSVNKPTKKIGLWMSTSLVVGNMIGAGIFLMPSALASYGGISILGWFFSAAGALLLAKVFSNLSLMVPNKSGGPYSYSKVGFGDFVAFLVAWGYWISIWVANAAIAIAFVEALSVFIPALEENKVLAVLVGLGAIWFLTWVNSKGIKESGKMQLITTALKLVPLLLIIVGGFLFFDPDNFSPFNLSNESTFGALSITVAMTLYAYMGVESATIPYLFSAATYVLITMQRKSGTTNWVSVLGLGVLAFSYSLWTIFGAGEEVVFWGFILLLHAIGPDRWMVTYKTIKHVRHYYTVSASSFFNE